MIGTRGLEDRLGDVEEAVRGELAARKALFASSVSLEHLVGDLQGVFKHLEAGLGLRERKAQAQRLGAVPPGTEAEPGSSPGEHVEGSGRLHP
jgi:hypothetical protein